MTTTALIGKKLGMTRLFQEDGRVVPVTVLEVGPCTIVQVKTLENDGYRAVQLGFGHKKKANRAELGHLGGLGPFRVRREVRVNDTEGLEVGQKIDVSIFTEGQTVDVTGRSRGMGFAGGVKRHHFHGGPKTHGQSDRHRAPGSIGAGTTPGRVLKGLRMAGHMGDERVTTENLTVVKVDPERNVLLVKGAVPGSRTGSVMVRLAGKRRKTVATGQSQ
jgi:large subunit ribosomal protein L3